MNTLNGRADGAISETTFLVPKAGRAGVKLVHLWSGITVICSNFGDKGINAMTARSVLRMRLEEIEASSGVLSRVLGLVSKRLYWKLKGFRKKTEEVK